MRKDDDHDIVASEVAYTQEPVAAPAGSSEHRSLNRWQFRADQLQLLYQQVQTELIISMLIAAIAITIFWDLAPPGVLLGWTATIVVTVGARSLFISGKSEDISADAIELWGRHYIVGVLISGLCWGALGIFAAVYGTLTHQLFVLFALAGISLTAYISMQSSPRTIATFVIPALLPITAWFFYQGSSIQLSLGILSIVFATLMLTSSRTTRSLLAKSFSLGSESWSLPGRRRNRRKANRSASTRNCRNISRNAGWPRSVFAPPSSALARYSTACRTPFTRRTSTEKCFG